MSFNITGHFLVSTPQVTDEIFSHSIVYVTEYNALTGAIGVIVNKPIVLGLENILKSLNIENKNLGELYFGGPLSLQQSFTLHADDMASGKLSLTNNKAIIEQNKNSARNFTAVGYSEWRMNQLETEVKYNDWLVLKSDYGLIYEVPAEQRYTEALSQLGINLAKFYSDVELVRA